MEQTILVTSADRGLGFALCGGLLKGGWPFLLNDRDDEDRLVMVDYDGNKWPW